MAVAVGLGGAALEAGGGVCSGFSDLSGVAGGVRGGSDVSGWLELLVGEVEGVPGPGPEDDAVGVWEGVPGGLSDWEGVPDGLSDWPGVTEGVRDGVTEGFKEGVTEGCKEGVTEGVTDGVTEGGSDDAGTSPPIPAQSTFDGLPFSQPSGLVNCPSAMTSRWTWHPVEKPVLPTRPTP